MPGVIGAAIVYNDDLVVDGVQAEFEVQVFDRGSDAVLLISSGMTTDSLRNRSRLDGSR